MKKFLLDESGQDLVEYSLLFVLLGIAAVGALTITEQSIGAIFSRISVRLNSTGDTVEY